MFLIFLGDLINKKAEGLSTIHNGVAQIGEGVVTGLKQKGETVVDAAGNVYTKIVDATGAATNFVMDSTGMILDTTKLAAEFLLDNAVAYPKDLMESARESRQDIQDALKASRDAASYVGKFAKSALPNIPTQQLHKPSSWISAAKENAVEIGGAYKDLSSYTDNIFDQFEDKYCTPAVFTPGEKKNGEVIGPSFFFEVGLGSCVVDEAKVGLHSNKSIVLDCVKPYITYGHRNATWTSKHHAAPSLVSKDCKIEKVHGNYEELVLFTFDYNLKASAASISSSVSSSLQDALQGLTSASQNLASQVTGFLGELEQKHGKNKIDQLVNAYSGYEQPSF